MLTHQKLILTLALVLLPASASAAMVYVVTGNQQFGTIDLATGAFHQIGPDTPEGSAGLVPGPNGSLLTLTFAGNLDSINPATGVTTLIGATGLADCTVANGRCGSTTANALAEVGGKLYATDLSNNLYAVNATTGIAHLIGPSGLPAVPPGTPNVSDSGVSYFDEGLYGVGGNLYTTFDAAGFDFATQTTSIAIAPFLYKIDPMTGATIRVAPTPLNLTATVDVNGTFYAFKANGDTSQLLTLDRTNGNTRFVTNIDPATGFSIGGAAPVGSVPEPASLALAGVGIAAMIVLGRRRGRAPRSIRTESGLSSSPLFRAQRFGTRTPPNVYQTVNFFDLTD